MFLSFCYLSFLLLLLLTMSTSLRESADDLVLDMQSLANLFPDEDPGVLAKAIKNAGNEARR